MSNHQRLYQLPYLHQPRFTSFSSFYSFLEQHNQLGTCRETFYTHMVTFCPNSPLAGSYWWTQIAINPTSKAASVWIPFTITKSLLRLKANSQMWAFVNVKEQAGYLQQTMALDSKREERGDSREVVSKAILKPSRANLKPYSFTWSCWETHSYWSVAFSIHGLLCDLGPLSGCRLFWKTFHTPYFSSTLGSAFQLRFHT